VWIVTRVSRVTVNVPFMTQAFPSPNAGCKTIDEAALSVNVYVIGTFSEFATLAPYEGFHCDRFTEGLRRLLSELACRALASSSCGCAACGRRKT
jgi:hypothetical protein